ncbi:MAG: DUF5069 domain-containing protein [Vulcanimicrobiaceae bacterium]
MDLTKSYPRSVHEKIAGVVMIARTADKAKAEANGNVGEYHYNCPMDKAVFGFLGIDHEKFLEKVRTAKGDAEIEAYVREFTAKKPPAELEAWNKQFASYKPEPGSEGEKYFFELRSEVAPDRTDVTAWPDLLDLDEKRAVPKRLAA